MKNHYICPCCNKEFEWDDSLEETMLSCPHCKSDMSAPVPSLVKGMMVGDYEIHERIGIGGMGEVYLAEQKSMQRLVALKILQEELVKDKAYLERFYREVRTLAQIEHPNIVRAIEAGFDGSTHYFSMTYIPAKDLRQRLEDGEIFSEYEILRIAREVASALKYVWEKYKLLHRDIKPANIIVTPENEVKLMDLGISKMVSERVELTMAGMMVGSPLYVSPEQAKARKDIDFRSDMYSLGITLYHLLTGKLPYQGDSAMAIVARHFDDPVPDSRRERPEISQQTSRLVIRMMAKKMEDRFKSWDDVIEDIDVILEELAGETGKDDTISPQLVTPETTVPERLREKMPWKSPEVKKLCEYLFFKKAIILNKPYRVMVFVSAFLVFIFTLFHIVRKSVHENRTKEAERLYKEALEFIGENPGPRQLREAIIRFDKIQRIGVSYYTSKAKEELKKVQDIFLTLKKKRQWALKKEALKELQDMSFDYERQDKFDAAINLWMSYKKNGAYAKEFGLEIEKALDYLKRRKKKKEEGLD